MKSRDKLFLQKVDLYLMIRFMICRLLFFSYFDLGKASCSEFEISHTDIAIQAHLVTYFFCVLPGMGIPEERLKRVDVGVKMEAAHLRKSAESKMSASIDFTKMAATESPLSTTTVESPLSNISNTDSDDSVDVRVRSPLHPKFRKRPRDPPLSRDEVKSDGSDVEPQRVSSASPSLKRSADGFVVPKKRFRRDYEAETRLEEKSDGETTPTPEVTSPSSPVSGCHRHRQQVIFECSGCLETIAKRFGWPVHALRSPSATASAVSQLPLPTAATFLPQYGCLPFSPFVDPLLAYRAAIGADPRLAQTLVADSRLSAGLLARGGPMPAGLTSSPKPAVQKASPSSAPKSPPVASRARAPSPAASSASEDAPLDLTRRRSSSGSSGSSNAAGSSGANRTAFSIENILAGKTAEASTSSSTSSSSTHAAQSRLASPPPRSPVDSVPSPLLHSRQRPVRPVPSSKPRAAASHRRTSQLPLSTTVQHGGTHLQHGSSPLQHGSERRELQHGADRRELANERERMRVKHLTGAFKELSSSISGIASECIGTSGVKFTKVAILRTASLYIGYLSHVLQEGEGETEAKVYDRMRAAILEVMTAKSKKGKDDDDDDDL